jgi:hypothetical protein
MRDVKGKIQSVKGEVVIGKLKEHKSLSLPFFALSILN